MQKEKKHSLPGKKPHDWYTKMMLGDIAVLTSFLKAHMEPALVERIDWATLKEADTELTNEYRSTRADCCIICSLMTKNRSMPMSNSNKT